MQNSAALNEAKWTCLPYIFFATQLPERTLHSSVYPSISQTKCLGLYGKQFCSGSEKQTRPQSQWLLREKQQSIVREDQTYNEQPKSILGNQILFPTNAKATPGQGVHSTEFNHLLSFESFTAIPFNLSYQMQEALQWDLSKTVKCIYSSIRLRRTPWTTRWMYPANI